MIEKVFIFVANFETIYLKLIRNMMKLLTTKNVMYRFLMMVLLVCVTTTASAQQTKITGTVKDSGGEPLIGVSVRVDKTGQGTVTDMDGHYAIEASSSSTLVFSYIGFETANEKVGDRKTIDVTLKERSDVLNEVVVIGYGTMDKKELTSAISHVSEKDFLTVSSLDPSMMIQGKVPGVSITNTGAGDPNNQASIQIRGVSSRSAGLGPLIVIDGVPGGNLTNINPNDIASFDILKDGAASAIYGTRGSNGVIVVTTKKGKEGKLIVNASAGVEIMNPFVLPRFQNRYGTGDLNSSIGSDVRSYGNLMNSSNNPGYDPAKDYFRTGATYTESVSVSTGNEKNQTYISGSAIDSDGIVPNNGYHRYNFTFRNTTSFLKDKMHLDVGASYIIQKDRNTTNQGTYNNPLVGAYIFPRGTDWEDIRMYERYDVTRRLYTQYWPIGDAGMTMQNPYWINYRNLRENRKDRYMLNASLSYEILDWLNIAGRVRVDNSTNKYTEKFYASTLPQLTESSKNGLYGISTTKDSQIYADVLLNIDKRFNEDWTLQANIGASITDMRYDAFKNRGPIADGEMSEEKPGLANVFNVQNLSNSQKTSRLQEGWREQTQSVFGSAEVGYKGAYYLTLTARNDWPSQLAGPHSNKKSFFYPSVGASVVLSQIIPNMPENLEYLKIRGSYASVGTAFERYIANPMYKWNSSGLSWNTQTQYPMYDLKPELTDSWEIGLSMRFLKWFSLEATYYHTNTKNQTFNPQISTGSGSSEIYIQSGDVMNQGCEISLGFGKDWNKFRWDSNLAFSTNQNKIISLADNVLNAATGEYFSVDQLDMNGLGLAHFILRKGGTLGDLYSFADFKYDSNGMIVVNEDGTVSPNMIAEAKDYVKLGSVLPKANLSWRNDFRIAGFNFGFLITARFGGIVYSSTQAVLDYYGVSEASAAARDAGGVFINGGDRVDANKWFSSVGGSNPLPQEYTYSGTNVRLQEASIGYTFPRKMLGNVCDLNLSIVGRNLWMIYNKAPFDPESVATTGNYYQGIDHFMMPSLRNFGFNVRITF